jgi:S-adenosylmethionine synthetase
MVSGPLFFLSEPQWGTAVFDRCLFTSESVTEGHPDKVADAISDAVLDALLSEDPASRVACETLVTTGLAVIAGEITTNAYVHLPEVVRSTIARIGYTDAGFGFDSHTCAVMSTIDRQSPDIAMGVDTGGAGDQGMMFGYATDETDEMMPMPIMLAHRITRALADRRRNDKGFKWLRPDGKAQVTVVYEDNIPVGVDTVVVSTQHAEDVTNTKLRKAIISDVIEASIPKELRDRKIKYHINPTGRFVIGGRRATPGSPAARSSSTPTAAWAATAAARSAARIPSKVDRSACYAARWVAKNVVAAGSRALRGAGRVRHRRGRARLRHGRHVRHVDRRRGADHEAVREIFDLTPKGIAAALDLRKPIYSATSAYGHFGRTPEKSATAAVRRPTFTWERTDKAAALKRAARG